MSLAITPSREKTPEFLYETTRSICPVCRLLLDAQVILRDNQVIQRKRCPQHGLFEALVFNDAELFQRIARYNTSGITPLGYATQSTHNCPYECGLCPDHKQHTCLGVIEVTNACNLDCPMCFADAGTQHAKDGYWLTHDQVDFMLNQLLAFEDKPEVVQFSGGEPTLHPYLVDFVNLAHQKGIQYVMVNTNGLRIANDQHFVDRLAKARPHIYLQFDGFEERTYRMLRGREDLLEVKLRALDRLKTAGLRVVLVAVIERGVNDHEMGRIVDFGLKHPAVFGVTFQCAFHAQRYLPFDPLQRMTIPDVVAGINAQTKGLFQPADFVPVPCCKPECSFVSYAILDGDSITPLPRVIDLDPYMDHIKGRTLPALDAEVATILSHLFSSSAIAGSAHLAQDVQQLAVNVTLTSESHSTRTGQRCPACQVGIPLGGHSLDDMSRHVFMLNIRDFADAWTFNLNTVMKCCLGFLIPDGRIIPFCAYNTLDYRQKVVESLMAEKSRSTVIPIPGF